MQAYLCHLSETCCAVGQVWPGSQAIKQAAHTFKELLAPQFLVAMALRAQEVLQQAQQPKHLLGEAGQDPSGGLFDVAQG